MTITILIFPHNFELNRAFFLLRSQVPIFPTHDHLGQDSPQRAQGAIINLFHKQVDNVPLHGVISDSAARFFFSLKGYIRTNLVTPFHPALDYKISFGYFFSSESFSPAFYKSYRSRDPLSIS